MDVRLRASDGDRERTVTALRRHVADGRISVEEFSHRAADAYGARTLGDLAAVTADLPTVEPAEVASSRSWARPAWLAAGLAALCLLGISLLAGFADAAAAISPMMGGPCP